MTQWRKLTDDERTTLAAKLRQAREEAGLTQRDAATALGIPQSTISELENGQRRLDMVELKVLAGLYGKPAASFLE